MGTSPASPTQADALIGQPEKWRDFGYRATHTMTIIAKQLTVAFYGKGAVFSFFRGCSTGGQQGLSEAMDPSAKPPPRHLLPDRCELPDLTVYTHRLII